MRTLRPALGAILIAALAAFGATRAVAQEPDFSSVDADAKDAVGSGSAAARKKRMAERAAKPHYDAKLFDLSGLPTYAPSEKVSGTITIYGNNYLGDSPLGKWWSEAFQKFHPDVKFNLYLPTAAIAAAGLYFNKADLGMNHELTFYDYLAHVRLKGFEPTGISVVTGSYDVIGWQNNMIVMVNKKNPLAKITMDQLDGVFGSRREGGWVGTVWHHEFARGPEKDIRTWGQLGLTGEWADKPVNTYGYSVRYATGIEFSNRVLKGSDKWNDNLRAYGNWVDDTGKRHLEADDIVEALEKDPYGIAYVRFHQDFPDDVKPLALAQTAAGPYYDYTIENLQSRKYPLWGDQLFFLSVKPGSPMPPKVREFLRFVLSRQGQELVAKDGKYLPLPADAVQEELKKIK